MSIETDLLAISEQEQLLRFDSFSHTQAWKIGCLLQQQAETRQAPVAIEIQVNGQLLFYCAMPGATPNNQDWIRRKRNTVERYQRSSYAIGLGLARQQTTLEAKTGAPLQDFATHGGSFPILLKTGTCIGNITVSGLPERQDHAMVVEALCSVLNQPLATLALPEGS
jgi:uncharacterized protein (UPF0303 family)